MIERVRHNNAGCNSDSVLQRMRNIATGGDNQNCGIRCRYSALQNAMRRGGCRRIDVIGWRGDVFFYRQFVGAVSERFAGAPYGGVAGGGEEVRAKRPFIATPGSFCPTTCIASGPCRPAMTILPSAGG